MISKVISLFCLLLGANNVFAGDRFIVLASTTSTQNSGLFDAILPEFSKLSGIDVRVVAVGTGAAVRLARNGDADVLLVHHKSSEEKFVAGGFGLYRKELMYNDFVLIGPQNDPGSVMQTGAITDALKRIASQRLSFISRGDDSGTHKRELELWRQSDIDPTVHSGSWYREVGAGMGAALNMAAAQNAYLLTDRGTWLSFANRQSLRIIIQGDRRLRNVYGVIPVSKARHPHVKEPEALIFVNWLLSPEGQQQIANYRIDGEQLFYPMRRAN